MPHEGKDRRAGKDAPDTAEDVPATPQKLAEEALKAVDDTTSVTVDGTAQVAGRDAYKLVIEPKQSGSTVGAISIAVDAKTGLPLKFTLTPASGGAAVVDAGFTKVDFGRPSASTFDFTPPKGAKVTEADEVEKSGHHESGSGDSVFEGPGKDGAFKDGKGSEGPKGLKGLKGPKGSKDSEGSEEEFASGLDGLKTIGKGWSTIAEFDSGAEGGMPAAWRRLVRRRPGRRVPELPRRPGQGRVRLGYGLQDPTDQRPLHRRRQGVRGCRHQGRAGEGGQRGEVATPGRWAGTATPPSRPTGRTRGEP